MGKVYVNNIRLFAYHGCLEEESIIGSDYRVDVKVSADLKKASQSDNLDHTVDYVHINLIVKEEMQIRSKLLEHVGKRILDRLFSEITLVTKARVAISKLNPPIGGDVESVSVVLIKKRS